MRIAIVNDIAIAREGLRRIVVGAKHSVAWTAANGAEAVQRCTEDRPDLMLMDLIMPVMDGAEATRLIMRDVPCPILIVTSTVKGNSAKVFEALGAGAFDAVNTPSVITATKSREALLNKISLVSTLARELSPEPPGWRNRQGRVRASRHPLIAIGSSAGGPAALVAILKELPPNFPSAIVIVQHIDQQFAAGLVHWLGQSSALPIHLVEPGQSPEPGKVLVAGTNDHLVFTNPTQLHYTTSPTDSSYRPSVDVFFQSAARHWPGIITGVLLTGMGRDGAVGLKKLRDDGHHTIAQDRPTSAVYGMPKAAAALNAAVEILPLPQIGPRLRNLILHP